MSTDSPAPTIDFTPGKVVEHNGQVTVTPLSAPDVATLVRQYVDKWQPTLRLSGWDIAVEFKETSRPEHLCENETEWRVCRALLTFPPDYEAKVKERRLELSGESWQQELERSVVHELLHVLEHPIQDQFNDEIIWLVGQEGIAGAECRALWRDYREWWINQVVRALIDLDRRGRTP